MRKICFSLLLFISAISLAQENQYKSKAEAAIKKGDYETAAVQYKAYSASIGGVGKLTEQQKLEKLNIEKALAKIAECKEASAAASQYYSKAMSLIEQYKASTKGDVDKLEDNFKECNSALYKAKEKYSFIVSKFSTDAMASSRIRDLDNAKSYIIAPQDFIRQMFLADVTPESAQWYISHCGANAEDSRVLRQDLSQWMACLELSGDEKLREISKYLSNSSNQLFRDIAQEKYDEESDARDWKKTDVNNLASLNAYIDATRTYKKHYLQDAEAYRRKLMNQKEDEERWNSTDKNNAGSLKSYVNSTTKYQKQHIEEAQYYLRRIEEKGTWNLVDKSNPDALYDYCQSKPKPAYYSDAEALIDELLWSRIDRTDVGSVKEYMTAYPSLKKTHLEEARTFYDELLWHAVDTKDKSSLNSYLSNVGNSKKAYCEQARAWIDVIDASQMSYSRPQEALKLLKNASSVVSFDAATTDLYRQLTEDDDYSIFEQTKTESAARYYLDEHPTGRHRYEVENWMTQYREVIARCQTVKDRMSYVPLSYKQYSETYSGSDVESYYAYLRAEKKKDFRNRAGGFVQWRFGVAGGGSLKAQSGDYPGSAFGGLTEIRFGNALQLVNFSLGIEALFGIGAKKADGSAPLEKSALTPYASLSCNLFRLGRDSRLYLAPGVGYELESKNIPIQVRIGIVYRRIDFGVFYRMKAYKSWNMNSTLDCVGASFIF